MFIKVALDPAPVSVTLEEPADCGRFHVAAIGTTDGALVGQALTDAAVGHIALDGDDAWVSVEGVRRLAADQVGPTWGDDFDAMLDYAATKGWLSPDRDEIRAHIEWSS